MQYYLLDRFKSFSIRHRTLIVLLFTCMLIGVILNLVRVSFSERMEMESNQFDEIQDVIVSIKGKDKGIYNNLEVIKVDKEVKGIDVSAWQGDIDWDKVKESGIEFAMIRCGLRNLSNDTLYEDSKFRYNISEANRVGIPVGVYFYSTAITDVEVLEEASFVLNLIKDYEVTYPVVYDFETFHQNRASKISDLKVNKHALKFLDYISGHGYYAVLYGNATALNNYWDTEYLGDYDVWLAQYIDVATYQGKYVMWQYADNGRVDGIRGYVDLDVSYVSYEIKE